MPFLPPPELDEDVAVGTAASVPFFLSLNFFSISSFVLPSFCPIALFGSHLILLVQLLCVLSEVTLTLEKCYSNILLFSVFVLLERKAHHPSM